MSQASSTIARDTMGRLGDRSASAAPHERWFRSVPRTIQICLVVLATFVISAIAAPVIAPHDPERQDLLSRLEPPVGFGGTIDHPLGTDHLGRDVLSRLVYGARVSLGIGVVGLMISVTIGVLVGLLAGMRAGLVDDLLMFLVDIQLALPFIVIALAAIALFGSSLKVLMIVVGFAFWESYARLTRGMVISTRNAPFVRAAEALGAGSTRVIARHVLPNVIAPIIVLATFLLTGLILLESTLSFLGIGVQPPTPSWGSMIGEGRDYLSTSWWIAVAPGLAIMLATMSISLVGDWLRDVLDPTVRSR